MNKDKVQNQNILGTLVNKDESGIIAYSDQIYDKKADKSLEEENVKQNERLDNVEAKDGELQSTLEGITKTGEASAASNVTYNHNDSQLNASNVQQAIDEIYSKGNTNRENDKTELEKSISDNKVAVDASIQDVYKKSNYNDGDNIIDFNTIHLITDNPEYICVAVDANDRILYGIKTDGQPYFGVGCPQQVKDYVNEQINKILGTDDISSTIDSLKEIESFLKDFTNSDTLKKLLDLKANVDEVRATTDDIYKRSNYNDGENIIDFNTIHLITDNPEFIMAAVDADDRILYGIKSDGQPYWGIGVPEVVMDYVDKQVNNILGTDNVTETIDSLKEVEEFLADFKNSDTLKNLLDTKANKTEVDSSIASISADIADKYKKSNPSDNEGNIVDTNTIFSIKDNPEYIKALTDSVGKLIEAIGIDGVRKFFAGINVQGTLQCAIDNPEYIAVWLDSQDRIIFGFKINGDPYFGYGIPSQINSVIESLKSNTETRINALQQSIDNNILALDYNSDTGELYSLTGEMSTINASMDDNGDVYLEQEII